MSILHNYRSGLSSRACLNHVNETQEARLETSGAAVAAVTSAGSECESICRLGSLTVGELFFVICQLKYGSQDKGT